MVICHWLFILPVTGLKYNKFKLNTTGIEKSFRPNCTEMHQFYERKCMCSLKHNAFLVIERSPFSLRTHCSARRGIFNSSLYLLPIGGLKNQRKSGHWNTIVVKRCSFLNDNVHFQSHYSRNEVSFRNESLFFHWKFVLKFTASGIKILWKCHFDTIIGKCFSFLLLNAFFDEWCYFSF